jgi:hypothetical protein
MTVTASINPQYPVPGREARVTFSASTGDYVRVFVTNAPVSSEYRRQLSETGASQLQVYEGDAGDVWRFVPDVGGVYSFAVYEVTKGASANGGGWHRSPSSNQTETPIGTTSLDVSVGQRLTSAVGANSDTATLVLWIWGSYIRETTFDVHGESSPALIDPSSDKIRNAITASTVKTRLESLIGVTASSALGNPFGVIDTVLKEINDHMINSTFHVSEDTDNNVLSTMIVEPSDPAQFVRQMADLVQRLDRHMRNDSNDGTGSGGSAYHTKADLTNTPLVLQVNDIASAVVAFADVYRAYEAHRVSSAAHPSTDTTNVLPALSLLMDLHRLILQLIQPVTPTSSQTENAGVQILVSGAGMKQS